MNLLNETEIYTVFSRWQNQNPNPQPELDFTNNFTLLVAVVLSAQATDKSVNLVTPSLFKIADSPKKMLDLGEEKLIEFIKSIGLYKNKSRFIIELSKKLIFDFNGKVPDKIDDLVKLPGVGRKTANVVLNVAFNQPTMPVDTHVFRVSNKIGLVNGKNPLEVEQKLLERIPKDFLQNAHHWILLHGRYICIARNPKCEKCIISDLCKKNEIK